MEDLTPKHRFLGNFCGISDLRGSLIVICLIWMGTNLYSIYLAFQPGGGIFFSYLNHAALIVHGIIGIAFFLGALFTLLALMMERAAILVVAHRTMWAIVAIFTVDMFVNVILFGVQRQEFHDWCLGQSRESIANKVSLDMDNGNRVQVSFTPGTHGDDLYNCQRLWVDEVKVASVIIVIITMLNMYCAACLWSFSQFTSMMQQQRFNEQTFIPPPTQRMQNIGKNERTEQEMRQISDDGGRSMAQIFSDHTDKFTNYTKKLFKQNNA